MNEWTVVLVIISLVGLFATVGKPIINLNSSIVRLNANVELNNKELEEQKLELKEQRKSSHESHEKLWKHNDEQDSKIQDHETRIFILEQK